MLQGYQGSLFAEVEPYFLSNPPIEIADLSPWTIPDRVPKPERESYPLEHDVADGA